ncbi:MAG TPA: SGNH/GDSL hydrolase family protein [Planctomycetes bacterium]|nr:SGNH/GDSL hydrolase family protein [Planctomycetota bacterium]HIK61566.1 SGNH/GDSL hydrolase family protein [Planctomycetota bacterium]
MAFSSLAPRLGLALLSTFIAVSGGWFLLRALTGEGPTVEFIQDADTFRAELARRAERGEQSVMEGAAELGEDFGRRLREDLTEADLRMLFPQLGRPSNRYVPGVHFGMLPNKSWRRDFSEHSAKRFVRRTNSMGWREDTDPGDAPTDLCILVMGDSHTEGVCANSESLANRFEHRLREERPNEVVEVWNVATGGFTPTNYMGTLTAYGEMKPHALVLVFYGGNDFRESLSPWRYLYRRPPGIAPEIDVAPLIEGGNQGVALLGQELYQVLGFSADPASANDALRLAQACGMELDRQCRERGMQFLFVYLPPPSAAQPDRFRERVVAGLVSVGGDPDGLKFSDILADSTLQGLEEAGVATLDLRPAFASAPVSLYWDADLHLNVEGHELTGQLIYQAFQNLPLR